MPNINSIVGLINTALVSNQFASRRYQSGKWYGIADLLKNNAEDKETTTPVIIDDAGEGTDVIFDDTSSMVVYHRVMSLNYEIADPNDYGKPGTTMRETAEMKMIFFADRMKLKDRVENFIAAAINDFPKEFLSSVVSAFGNNKTIIELGSVNTDIYTIWSGEFQNVDFNLASSICAFELTYKVINEFNKNCFTLCP